MNDLILHQWEISPFCQKVKQALEFKSISFQTKNYNGFLSAKALSLSSVGKLPVLQHGSKYIQDSTKIAQYLDLTFESEVSLYPKDPIEKVHAELWEDWADESLYFFEVYFRVSDINAFEMLAASSNAHRPYYEKAVLKPILKMVLKMQINFQGMGRYEKDDIENNFYQHLDRIETILSSKQWLVGTQRSIADIAVNAQIFEIYRTSQKMREKILERQLLTVWLKRQNKTFNEI